MNLDRIVELLIALGTGGVLVEGVRGLVQRRKMGADYADVIAKTAVSLLAPLERRIDELEEELGQCKARLQSTNDELSRTKEELGRTKAELSTTKRQLSETQKDLKSARQIIRTIQQERREEK